MLDSSPPAWRKAGGGITAGQAERLQDMLRVHRSRQNTKDFDRHRASARAITWLEML